jgi:3-hydroxyacyl-[acyl-carrier-protein] dehydratase
MIMDIAEILDYLPHRYPFLLVDKVLELEVDKSIKALKNVTINEPFFQGHWPNRPVMPGVLILEALAQTAAIFAYRTLNEKPSQTSAVYFAGLDNVRFKKIVMPGDQLILDVELVRKRKDIWKFNTTASVNGQIVCHAEILAAKRENT